MRWAEPVASDSKLTRLSLKYEIESKIWEVICIMESDWNMWLNYCALHQVQVQLHFNINKLIQALQSAHLCCLSLDLLSSSWLRDLFDAVTLKAKAHQHQLLTPSSFQSPPDWSLLHPRQSGCTTHLTRPHGCSWFHSEAVPAASFPSAIHWQTFPDAGPNQSNLCYFVRCWMSLPGNVSCQLNGLPLHQFGLPAWATQSPHARTNLIGFSLHTGLLTLYKMEVMRQVETVLQLQDN